MVKSSKKYGLSLAVIQRICAVFTNYGEVERAIIYGSRAMGNYRPGSDIDLTLCGERLTQKLLWDISAKMEELPIPYTVDLSVFADLKNTKLKDHIERVGEVFYDN